MTGCVHGMPTPAACTECMADGNLPVPSAPEPETAAGPAFPARYPGQCPACNLPIHEGQLVIRTSRNRYLHADRGCL